MNPRLLRQLTALPETDLSTVSSLGTLNPILPASERTFYHSGDLGDIIYSLPTVRALGGGRLYIGPATRYPTRQRASPETVRFVRRLLEMQPYITSVEYREDSCVVYDLNRFRDYLMSESQLLARGEPRRNLAEAHLLTFRQPLEECYKPWLTVDRPVRTDRPVLIHRSARWRNPQFPWDRVMALHGDRAAFIGLRSEYDEFVRNWGALPYFPIEDLLGMARLIAGCRLFIGNQSLPYALAAALHKDSLLEVWPAGPNCMFPRPNALYGTGKIVYVPPLDPDLAPTLLASCPLCGSKETAKDRHPDLIRCPACNTSYQPHPPSEAALARQCQAAPSLPGSHLRVPERVADIKTSPLRRDSFMQALLRWCCSGKLLDVGAGWGAFADHARECGFEPTACEIAANPADFCTNVLGIPVLNDDFCRSAVPHNQWDVITLLHTLEHLPKPQAAIKKIHDLLKPGGLFAGIIPNYESRCSRVMGRTWPWLDLNEHLIYVGPESFRRVLEKNGFQVKHLTTCLGDFPRDLAEKCASQQQSVADNGLLGEEIWFFAAKI